jgi:hypothetical protein
MNTQDACDILNWLLKNDTICLRFWEMSVFPANVITAHDHPTIQVDIDPQLDQDCWTIYKCSPLGILNGMLGQANEPYVVRTMERPDGAKETDPWICVGYRPATEEEMKNWVG